MYLNQDYIGECIIEASPRISKANFEDLIEKAEFYSGSSHLILKVTCISSTEYM